MRTEWIKAGPLEILFDNGAIRYIKYESIELVRGIYSALRDENWDTIVAEIHYQSFKVMDKSFIIAFKAIHKRGIVHYEADYTIVGSENGDVEFEMKGKAFSNFRKCRIGFCVLHPLKESIGQKVKLFKPDQSVEEDVFPALVNPNQIFFDVEAMEIDVVKGGKIKLAFEGDIFETEDQRNWSDASFKTYCTPLAKGYPLEVKENEIFFQKVKFSVLSLPIVEKEPKQELTLNSNSKLKIGLGISTSIDTLTDFHVEKLKALQLNHLRVDLILFKNDWEQSFSIAKAQAILLNTKLEIALHFGQNAENELNNFISLVKKESALFEKIIVFQYLKKGLESDFENNIVLKLKDEFQSVSVGAGSDANFYELNTSILSPQNFDFFSFAINPQVHAFDDVSVMESIESHRFLVATALKLSDNKSIVVSPITLKQRFNPSKALAGIEEKPLSDERQKSIFLANWTSKCIKELQNAGANSVTLFETVGDRGIMDDEVFPVYQVLLDYK